MKKCTFVTAILTFSLLLFGCGKMVKVSVDPTPLSMDKSTVIIYEPKGINDVFKVSLDGQPIGQMITEKPLKISVEQGRHDLHVDADGFNQVFTRQFDAGKVYFVKVEALFNGEKGTVELKLSETDAIDSYEARSFK